MNYKIVSKNSEIIQKANHAFNILDMKESIHIQEVDLWLVDVKTIDKQALLSYINRFDYSNIIFVVNDNDDIKLCLDNSFSNYIQKNFSIEELISWCKYFQKAKKKDLLELENDININFLKKTISFEKQNILLTQKEIALLKELSSGEFVNTKLLTNALSLNTQTSVRTIINRIRKKTPKEFIYQKRDYGYKLNLKTNYEIDLSIDSNIKELEEQNLLMQEIIDSSPIFIVTFIHKQLHCINKSFRNFLGNEIIKELWDEEKGDFFQLIKHNSNEKEELKHKLFSIGEKKVHLYNFNRDKLDSFIVKTFYFENIDKHLFIFLMTK